MESIKSYTDLEQSKKLAEILPLESADMHYCLSKRDVPTGYEIGVTPFIKVKRFEGKGNIVNIQPAWSLAALHGVLQERIIKNHYAPNLQKEDDKYSIAYGDDELLCIADNPVDACVVMIEKLHKLKML